MMPLLFHLLATLALTQDAPSPATCRQELDRIHTVSAPEGRFLLYGDPLLAEYLQRLTPTPVIPIYEDEPVAFNHNGATVVSTGLILQASSEADLLSALPARPPRTSSARRAAASQAIRAACSAYQPLPFAQLQARLATDISRYKLLTTPRLISRTQPVPNQ
ncbi:MAG: hypothetical protein HZB13_10715 [Acidobacteria bacterium]|nr:hypothetical protein [Acidobacteriota bacterium]